jgi:hypothetical protein
MTMKTEKNLANALCPVSAAELQAVSGGWCGNDPLFPKGPQPSDPLRSALVCTQLPGVDTRIGASLSIMY